jgi:type I restriction enzyme M protein
MEAGDGRAGIVMPHGALFRGGKEAVIREKLIRADLLEAVIGLPNNLFYSTSIPVCLLIFRKTKPVERKSTVLFVDGKARFKPGKNQNAMDDDDIDAISRAYRSPESADADSRVSARLVEIEELEQNNFDLNIGRYLKNETVVEANVEEAIILMREAQERLAAAQVALDVKLKAAGFDA